MIRAHPGSTLTDTPFPYAPLFLSRHFDILDPEDVSREGGLSSSQVRRIRERLEEEDANNPITVAELAQREGLSVRHFSRLFRVSTGKAVSDYVAEVRIKRATTLLADDRVLIKEIAYRCGFQSSSSFSSAFRRAPSLTPPHSIGRAPCRERVCAVRLDPGG